MHFYYIVKKSVFLAFFIFLYALYLRKDIRQSNFWVSLSFYNYVAKIDMILTVVSYWI